MVMGETLMLVFSDKSTHAVSYDINLNVIIPNQILSHDMDCHLPNSSDQIQSLITPSSLILQCLTKQNTKILLTKAIYFYNQNDHRSNNSYKFLFIFCMGLFFFIIVFTSIYKFI